MSSLFRRYFNLHRFGHDFSLFIKYGFPKDQHWSLFLGLFPTHPSREGNLISRAFRSYLND